MPLVDTLVVKLLVDGASQLSDLDAGAALLDATTKKLTTTTQKATAAGNENAATNERVTKAVRTTTAQYASFIASQDKASAAALTYAKSMDQAARFVRELQLGEEALTVLQGLVQQKFDQTTAAINKANAATKAYNDNVEQTASHIAAYAAEIDRLKPKYDTVYAAGLKLTEAQKEINLLFRAGEISADLAAVSLAEATAAYDKVATAAGNASRALRSAVPPAYAEFLAEVAAYDAKVEGLAQTYDKVYVAELRFKKVQEDINLLLGANRISQEAANAELREAAALRDKASGVAPVPAAKAQQVFPQEATDHIKAFNAYADQLRVKFDAIYAAYVKQQAALKEINEAFRFNAVSTAQWREETDKINAAYNQTVKEINEVAAASNRVKPPQQQTAQIQAYADEVERLRLKYDPLYAAEQKQVAALAEINNALRLNALTQEQADAEIQATTRAYNDQVLAIQKAAAAARLTPTAGGGDQNAQIKAYNDLIDQQRAKYVPLFAAEQKLKAQLADINKSYQMGALSQTEYIATVDEAVTRHEKYAESLKKTTNAAGTSTISTGQLNAAVTNLGFQINDIASGLLSGQSPFTILVQQGGQVIQAFSQGGGIKEVLGGLRTSIAAMITPTTLAVGGLALLAGAIVYLGARALAEQQRIKDFNNQLRVMGESSLATGAELDASTKSWSKFGLSVTESGKALNDMLLGGLNPKFRDQIAQLGADLGAFTHQGSAAGIQQITTALKGGLQPLIQLGFQYHLITAAEAEHYEAMQRSNKGAEAQIAIFNKLQSALKGYEKSTLGPVTLAVRDLTKAWSDLLDEMGKALAPAAQTFLNGLAELAKIITAAFKGDLHLDITLKMPPGIPDIHIGDVGGPQQGKEVPLAGSSGAAGGGATGRVSMGPNAVAGAGTAQIMAILAAAAPKALPEGQGFQIFSAYAPGGGNRSTGAASLHARGNAGDYRVINIATGDIIDTGVVGLDTMGKGLPTPEMERAVLEAAKAQNVPVSIGGTFSKPDPGHIGVGANEAEVQNNQARQQLLLQGKILLNEQQQKDAANEITRVANEQLEADKRIGLSQAESLAKIEAEKIIKEQGLEGTAADEVRTTKLLEARQKVATETYKENVLLNAQAVTTNTIADSYAKGGLAVAEATAQTQAATEMQAKLGNQVDKTYATEVRRKELLGTMQSQERLQNAQDTQAQKDTQEALTLEISLQGQSSDVITEQLTLLKAKQEIEEKFPLLSEAEKAARLATVKATADQTAALAEVQRAQQRLNDVLTSVGQTIDQDITQNIENALSGQKITQWHTIFKNVLVQLESQLISLSIIKPAIGSVLGFLGFGQAAQSFGTLTGPGGILSGGGAGSLLGGVFGGTQQQQQPITLEQRDKEGNLTGTLSTVSSVGSLANTGSGLFGGGGSGGLFGGFGNWLNTSIGQPLGFAQPGLIQGTGAGSGIFMNSAGVTSDVAGGGVASGLFGGTTLTSALGGIGAGATVGSLANSFIGPLIGGGKSTGGMIGSTGGAIAGTLLGSLIGMPFLGGLIGGSAGGLLGGFFGPKPANNAGSGSLNLATGQLGAFTSGGVAANDQQAQGILQPISTTLANITQILGASVLPQATLIAQAGSRDGIKVNIASGEGVKSFTGSDAGAVVQEVAQFLFEHRDLSALSPTLQKAVGSLDINQIQDPTQLTTAVNFSKIYDSIVTAADDAFKSIESGAQQAGPFEQAMTQISDTFSQLTDQANKYGISIDPINAALAEATKRLNVDFAKAVDAAFNTATGSDFLNGVQAVVDNYKSMAREASAIGASSTVFDKLGQTFDAQLNSLFSQMTSTQLNAVLAAFGDLTDNDLPALATAARDAALATEALNASLAQQAQMYQNQNDYYTANNQGFLSQLRDLDKARVATQAANKAVGLGADQDALVQESEHRAAVNLLMALTNDQMEQARSVLAQLNPAFAAWVDEAEAAVKATNDGADASARAAKVLQDQANIQAYLNQLQTQASVFTSGKSRLDAAQSQYNTTLAAAQGGDETALSQITTAAQTLLQNVSDYYASSAPGQAIFKQVQDQLTALLGAGLTTAPDKTTTDVVNAITDDTATTTANSNANAVSLINAGIDAAKQITDNAVSTSAGVISAAKAANENLVSNTITTGAGITQATLDGAASIVGGSATQFAAQTVTLMTGTGTLVDATTATTSAVVSSGTDIVAGTVALLDNNVTNSASLISSNSNNAIATIAANTTNAASLQAAGAAQTSAIIDGNTSNATTLVNNAAANTNTLIATNDNHTALLAATAQATTDRSVATAVSNTQAMAANADINTQYVLATIAAWSGAIINSQVAWDNAINGTIAGWGSAIVSATGGSQTGTIQAVFAAADSIVGTIAGWENAVVGSVWGAASSVVANGAVDANSVVAAVYGSASGIVSTVAAYENATRASVDSTNSNLAGWLNNVYNAVNATSTNDAAWNQNLYNKLQEILDNMIGWNRNLWDQLHYIGEYISFLTEVTINFDEWMAANTGANTDIMNQIQQQLRRNSFG